MGGLILQKIDLHIHTISSVSDRDFEFDMSTLKKYLEEASLSGIAITNHNLFDRDQFDTICKEVDIPVFAGIEVDVENCHVLVIAPNEKINKFVSQCIKIDNKINTKTDFIKYEEFINIFDNLKEYIVIPHYENKKPKISQDLLKKFGDIITTGEVSNPKRWYICKNDEDKMAPVIFSDIRIERNLKAFPNILTYIDCDEVNFSNLKLKLSNKGMLHLNTNNQENEFVIHGEVNASDKLNLILGKRSTGKTHLLSSVANSYPQDRVKYIEQFQIVKKAEEDSFKEYINVENVAYSQNYLKKLDEYVENIANIDYLEELKNLDAFVTTLNDYAEEEQLDNVYSKCALFLEEEFRKPINNEYNILIDSIKNLLDSNIYKDIIDKFIDRENIKKLLGELLTIKKDKDLRNMLKEKTNNIISETKAVLARKSSRTQIHDINFIDLAREMDRISTFNYVIDKLLEETTINELSEETGRFKRIVTRRKYINSRDIKKYNSVGQLSLVDIMDNFYNKRKYYTYIKELQKKTSSLVKGSLLVCLEYDIHNEKNKAISGGERAEFLLIKEIQQANKYDLLLIDEPEASFDNSFLHDSIKNYIYEVSRNTTTFITTHNSSLGADIFPEKLIYTTYNEDKDEFEIYSGKFGAEDLTNKNGDKIPCSEIVYTTLESGEKNYEDRRDIYENLKNKK